MQNRRRLFPLILALILVNLSTATSVFSRTRRSPNGWRGSYAPYGSYYSRVNPSVDYKSVDVRVGLKSQYLNQTQTSSSVVTGTTLARVVQQPTNTNIPASVKEDRQNEERLTASVRNPSAGNSPVPSSIRESQNQYFIDQTSYIPLKQPLEASKPIRTQVALTSDKLLQSRGDDVKGTISQRIQNNAPSKLETLVQPHTVTGHEGELTSLVPTRPGEPDHVYLMTVYPNLPQLLKSSHNNNEGVQISNNPLYKSNGSRLNEGTLRVIHDAKLLTPPQGYLPAKYIPLQRNEPSTATTAAPTTTTTKKPESTTKRPLEFKPSQHDIQYLPFTPQDARYFNLDAFSDAKTSPNHYQEETEPSSRLLGSFPEARNSFREDTTIGTATVKSSTANDYSAEESQHGLYYHQNGKTTDFKPEFYSDFKPMFDESTTTTVKPDDSYTAATSLIHEDTSKTHSETERNYETYPSDNHSSNLEYLEENQEDSDFNLGGFNQADSYSYTYPERYPTQEEYETENDEYQSAPNLAVFDDADTSSSEEDELVSKVVVVAETKNKNRKKPAYSLENHQTISGKVSPKGVMYTVTQGLSKVKFFGNNPLHGKGQPLIYLYEDEPDWKRDDYLPLSFRNPSGSKRADQRRRGATPPRRQKITRQPDDSAKRTVITSPLRRHTTVNH